MSQETEIPSLLNSLVNRDTKPTKISDNSLDALTNGMKISIARSLLERLRQKFPQVIGSSVLKELDRINANLEIDFISQRSPKHLARLAYSIHFIRYNLLKNIAISPLQNCYDVRVLTFSLRFTFGSKPVLGILTHAHLKNKYEAFDEEHVLSTIRKSVSEAQLVTGSVYTFQSSKSSVKTLYFEISKRSGLVFSKEEIMLLKNLLKREIKYCVQKLVPSVFMVRNEEEVLRSILTLSREIHQVSDLPQVMILFDQQTDQEVIFTVILVCVHQQGQSTVLESLAKQQGDCAFLQDRCQIVRYLRKKYPIEANVFRVVMTKDHLLLRGDLSLNFYRARQKISQALIEAVGEFRDFNGGIILKQREALTSFTEAFPTTPFQNPDLLENFFYSLSPIETQATLPTAVLKVFFTLFIDAYGVNITKSSDSFLKCEVQGDQFFIMIRSPDITLKEVVDNIFSSLGLIQAEVVTSMQYIQNTYFLGYVVLTAKQQVIDQLSKALDEALKDWRKKVENQQILKLGLEPTVVSLDPRIGGDQISSVILKMLFEGLMRENKEGAIDYGIAKRVEISSDLKTYFFKLRTSRWSDGSVVSAFDFEYAWKKILSPSFKTPFAYLFYPIKN